jgi:beta-N-acetylhexosaminidase
VRRRAPHTDEFVTSADPTGDEIAALRDRVAGYDLVIVGTAVAHLRPEQAALANALLAAAPQTISVALRTPWDVCAYQSARTYVCTYGILGPSMEALAAALFGEHPFSGGLPVEIRAMHPRGHGLS